MDYMKLRKWIRFYECEGVDVVSAVYLLAFYLGHLNEDLTCYETGVCQDCFTCNSERVDLDDVE